MSQRSRISERRGRGRENLAHFLKADHSRRIDVIIDYFGARREATAVGARPGERWRAGRVA